LPERCARRVSERKTINIHVAEGWPMLGLDEFNSVQPDIYGPRKS
jgi:hypothetical protein